MNLGAPESVYDPDAPACLTAHCRSVGRLLRMLPVTWRSHEPWRTWPAGDAFLGNSAIERILQKEPAHVLVTLPQRRHLALTWKTDRGTRTGRVDVPRRQGPRQSGREGARWERHGIHAQEPVAGMFEFLNSLKGAGAGVAG